MSDLSLYGLLSVNDARNISCGKGITVSTKRGNFIFTRNALVVGTPALCGKQTMKVVFENGNTAQYHFKNYNRTWWVEAIN